MLQTIKGLPVEVVEFDTMPELPILGLTEQETKEYEYLRVLGVKNRLPTQGSCAMALTEAIETGLVTEPGKYGIHITHSGLMMKWNIFKINE